MVDWTEEHGVRLVTVVFPDLANLDWSRPFTQKMVRLLRSRRVPVVDLSEKLSGRDPRELVVNNFDAHPSVRLHAEVASLIRAELVEQ